MTHATQVKGLLEVRSPEGREMRIQRTDGERSFSIYSPLFSRDASVKFRFKLMDRQNLFEKAYASNQHGYFGERGDHR
jgi:hypothetical protein